MKLKHLVVFLCILAAVGAYFLFSSSPEDTSHLTVGDTLEIDNTDSHMTLLSNLDTLATDGLYYAAWGIGSPTAYENSDGKTEEIYGATLCLLLGECKDSSAAQSNMDTWLAAGKSNYEILGEESTAYYGQPYTKLTYRLKSENSPYARGISLFGTFGSSAICMELICQRDFTEDLEAILTGFLGRCAYIAKED